MSGSVSGTRFEPCFLLYQKGVQSVIWFEDALYRYSVPTAVFKLYLLVLDINQASQVLEEFGWTLFSTLERPAKISYTLVDKVQRCFAPPGMAAQILEEEKRMQLQFSTNPPPPPPPPFVKSSSTIHLDTYSSPIKRERERPPPPLPSHGPPPVSETVLLLASDWNYTFVSQPQRQYVDPFPELPKLLDALIDALLDCSNNSLILHLSCLVLYLYEYNPEVKEKSFAKQLKVEHQQFHYDQLSGMKTAPGVFLKHERDIRDQIRRGVYSIKECSVGPDHELFDFKKEKALQQEFEERMKLLEHNYEE
jgi:hypothetical protein